MLAVNLSAYQFADPHLADTITGTLDAAGVPAANLWLEITESALLTGHHVHATIRALGLLGIKFAIDDFGTGYSSLAHLRDTPVDALKIDRGFVAGLLDDPRDRALIVASLDLARAFGLLVTAEGIETDPQRLELTDLGCRYAQGYLWSPPVAADRITEMMAGATATASVERATEARGGARSIALGSSAVNGAQRTASVVGSGGTPPHDHRAGQGGQRVDGTDPTGPTMPPWHAPMDADAIVSGVTRQLLHAESAAEVRDILLTVVHQLGGTTVLAQTADDAALPVDLSLGAGTPLLPTADPDSIARMHLERHVPGLVADARQALDALARTQRLSTEASTDHLTQLGNRATFARLLSRIGPDDLIVALDLDGFKAANDTHGHAAGDDVLREFAACLRDHLRANDHAIRLGGDEFAFVLTGTDVDGGLVMLDRLRAAWYEQRSYPVDFSAGLTPALTSPAETYENADRALYAAKTAGRGRTTVADPIVADPTVADPTVSDLPRKPDAR